MVYISRVTNLTLGETMVDENLNNAAEEAQSDESTESVEPEAVEESPDTTTESEEDVEKLAELSQQELEEKLNEAQKTEAELKDRMLRIQADFENFRKRTVKEKQDIAQYTLEEFIKKLLPVLDNLDRAIEHSSTENMEAFRQGVELVLKQFKDVLSSEGLKEVETENVEFNPNYHHGVAVENNPEVEDQHITEVFQKGYQLKDKVIRPAMVKVNQK